MVTAVRPARTIRPTRPARPSTAPPRRLPVLRHLGPHWYAPVMGTAIVASAGTGLPLDIPGLRTACAALWALALVTLLVLLGARALHWTHHRDQARAHLLDPAVAPFYGCLSMALSAVGAGALVVGRDWIGVRAAVALDVVLFGAGTAVGLVAAVVVPYLMVVRHRIEPDRVTPVLLLPLVAPMVSAALGPLLVPHLPPGQARQTLLFGCLGLFGLSLLATLLVLPLVFGRLVTAGPLPLALTPSLFLVLGPLGQSTTAVGNLADAAPGAVPAPYTDGFTALAVLYGVPVMGFALLWLAIAAAMVVRARRRGMGFSMAWWAFTFPVGTCATGTEGLARHTGLVALDVLAVALYALLLAAWATAAASTLRGLVSGELLAAPRPVPAEPRPTTARTR
ncbi:TDT family transporter [Streptomyces europaeiscabiei]|uniref:TDT family transporter n=2 Tax=Streptomyces europaeiscabiei TaxID=146819 RepID=A0ABU4NPI7_9ACTN|nr:TDT family transporter [Streptomyces europaeiscabiei]MDX2525084.1 TDT family transporter [Streptomyces europaeiscabiei]MDX3546848.1 TDT family transporter [Streptomyces europaeiscabiei]MDX3556542.1 TDT family transporter [Streptomyces europaeiscabiei]MDX3704249.1 TDT family transporter [Streptomyces europaeiscabiei]MDX3863935.1 TDT family transporter [Streptomyces europaeiscabiei]